MDGVAFMQQHQNHTITIHNSCVLIPVLVCFNASQVTGGGLRDSFLVDGVAFKKTFSYAGFEQQPKAFDNPKILLLNIELELKAEKENAEVRVYKHKTHTPKFV